MSKICIRCDKEFKQTRGNQIYCSRRCFFDGNKGENNCNYKGGTTRPDGYRVIMVDGKRMLEHRFIMEQHLGRKLLPTEVVHHIDENPSNNMISNLKLYDSHARHFKDHRTRFYRSDTKKQCNRCLEIKDRSEFTAIEITPGSLQDPHIGVCHKCEAERMKKARKNRSK